MHLTHLKLAGFKSFVDPTTLHIHGRRIGVVGPNGCGKSNVIESIRWVLGESSAREMRGDSMQDVIFNGSGNRKPVSRASVELFFDNSLGRAGGPWSGYTEISVKRVLQRNSDSGYFINNTQVRRRDVADLFLGTGLGARAYAIIGQNTISRIVEAKPEELRVFLEEAAGTSRYRERRRETELRLRDTRENLSRVQDVRAELEKQILRLESQALAAQHYHALQQQMGRIRGQIWLLKQRVAARGWEKSRNQVERLGNDLESRTATLRKLESELESMRLEHHDHTTQLQDAQGRLYEAGAKVAALEQELRHRQETRERLVLLLAQTATEQKETSRQQDNLTARMENLRATQQQLSLAVQQAEQALQRAHAALPEAEQQAGRALTAFETSKQAQAHASQQIALEQTRMEHASASLAALGQRWQRLADEKAALVEPDAGVMAACERETGDLRAALSAKEKELAQWMQDEQQAAQQLKKMREAWQQEAHQIAGADSRLTVLRELQQSLEHEGEMEGWLRQHGMDAARRMWQFVRVEAGCETALESLLGARLNAVLATPPGGSGRPPATLVLCNPAMAAGQAAHHARGWRPLLDCLSAQEDLRGVLEEWLAGAWLLPEGENPGEVCRHLLPGEVLVSRAGDLYSRNSVTYYVPQSTLHGVLERQREADGIAAQLPHLQQAHDAQQAVLQKAERSLQELRQRIAELQQSIRGETAAFHVVHLRLQQLQQAQQHVLERRTHLSEEEDNLASQETVLQATLTRNRTSIAQFQSSEATLAMQCRQCETARLAADAELQQRRDKIMAAEREVQQQTFSEKLISSQINEVADKCQSLSESGSALETRRAELDNALEKTDSTALQPDLVAALAARQQAEQILLEMRNQMAGVEQGLQGAERDRLQAEQQLSPCRDKLEQARLDEQQARLYFEHCSAELEATGIAPVELEQGLESVGNVDNLNQRVASLDLEIEALGAVNLAAAQELESERERMRYLNSQTQDLGTAMATLEEAIRRMDRETRGRLQATYDEANRHFGEMFSILFGGGQARLQLTGEEILDTGIQVFAQPPGKKNSTIHLLSGGEKALTALALVFALFRLNPAPFCLMDEVDAPLDDSNTERFCALVRQMSEHTQFMFVSHNKISMEMAQQLIGVTMQESGVSRIVEVDIESAMQMQTEAVA